MYVFLLFSQKDTIKNIGIIAEVNINVISICRKSTVDKVMDVQLLCILITRKTKRCISVNWYSDRYESTSRKIRNRDRENERNVHLRCHVNM